MWHGYFVVERETISAGNWDALRALFEAMGTLDSNFPAYNNHKRTRLDGDAVIYESNFNPGEVSIEEFKQLLADEFGVPVEEIGDVETSDDYAGHGTATWTFSYNLIDRFIVRRFGGGGTWQESGDECRGYLKLYQAEWEPAE